MFRDTEINFERLRVIKSPVSRSAVSELLKTLDAFRPGLLTFYRTLIGTLRTNVVKIVGSVKYIYAGLKKAISELKPDQKTTSCCLSLQLHFD